MSRISTNTSLPFGVKFKQLGKIAYFSLVISSIFTLPASAQEKAQLWRTLTVSGSGVETIATTLTRVSLGVEVQGKTAQEVQQEAARRSSAVVNLLKSRKVEKLETTGVRLNPVYSYTNNIQRITGYAASNTVSFRFPTDKVGSLLDEAIKTGASEINGISFVATDEAINEAQKQALRKATQEAKKQAEAVLSSLGFQTKEIISIQINNASAPPPPILQRSQVVKASASDAVTPIVGGEQQVEASVTLQISY
ncbi:SIMPL domain-containing protein [Cylindrospermopsis raciborskii]|uniref:SIMPL domain-containing protein n=1 Tax=Cylindrospermopsis raciborskii TaxID=77022 RepID=UPI000778B344|nr:SIMPL domain-containing protein [Cylindrospermopsis raciborskii]MCZ2200832.1 SIMPL domain-containing protein [Cylindrospermopsis raciborskii PAMP2012]MCZ2204644.1 SIMPL domain-containing protein [Cylindrospermopsis raciborskii PAMP2011]